jgi:tryptophan 2,3-dioxygenase
MTDDEVQALLDDFRALSGYLSDATTVGELAARREEALRRYHNSAPDLARALLEARAERDSIGTMYATVAGENKALEAELAAAQAQIEALRNALTPSGDTKAAYMGEIKDPETKRMVSWTAIKMVMAMIAKRAALATATPGDGGEG